MFINLKIASRLLIGFGLLMILIGGLSGYTVFSSQATKSDLANVLRLKGNELLDEKVERQIYQARYGVWKYLAVGDAIYFDNAKTAIDTAEDRLSELAATTEAPERKARLNSLRENVAAYKIAILRFKDIGGHNIGLDSSDAKALIDRANEEGAKIDDLGTELAAMFEQAAANQTEQVVERIEVAITVAILIGAVSLVLGLLLSFLITRSVTHPLKAITTAMEILAGGDLEVAIPFIESSNELGAMARAVRVFKDNALKIEKMTQQQEQAKQTASIEQKRAPHAMADAFEASVMGVVKTVASSATEMQSAAQSMSSAAEQTRAQATSVASAATQASTNVETVAAAAEELSASIAEISGNVTESARISSEAADGAMKTNARINSLSTAADRIGEVVKLITDIASQTNLLALNATIEAARAGEAGKGFAVVANEVKHLANQTGKATDEIDEQVSAVQSEVRMAVEAIAEISQVIDHVREISAGIASAVEEQGAATQEIARNVSEAARGTQDVSCNIGGVTEAAATNGVIANQVLSAASELARNSELLRSEVVEFLTKVRAG